MTNAILKLLAGAALIVYAWRRRQRRPDIDLHADRFWAWQTHAGSVAGGVIGVLLVGSAVAELF